MYKLLSLLCVASFLLGQVVSNDNLKVAYQWKQVDYEFTDAAARKQAIESKEFIPENVIPVGLEVYKNRLFITLPRWKTGVPATLTYIDLNGKNFIPCIHFGSSQIHSFTFTLHFIIIYVLNRLILYHNLWFPFNLVFY